MYLLLLQTILCQEHSVAEFAYMKILKYYIPGYSGVYCLWL